MEPWACLLHGKVWHGSLYGIHRSHHTRRTGRFELNDVLSATHAPIAAALIMVGCNLHGPLAAAIIGAGAGMTVFGVSYVLVHDGLVHRRIPVAFLGKIPWLRGVREAHAVHHARGAAPYGLFLGQRELARARRAQPPAPDAAGRPDAQAEDAA
jgi:beta-carotene 3-hydroxylase